MRQFFKNIGMGVLRQLFGLSQPRAGKITLTAHAFQKMTEYKLDPETVENAFRHGRKSVEGKSFINMPATPSGVLQAPTDIPQEPSTTGRHVPHYNMLEGKIIYELARA